MEPYFLPPGFRFHPTDEELITHYLLKKVLDSSFTGNRAIADIDLNKCEPWHLPLKSSNLTSSSSSSKEWYFFSLRDRKYPTGLRTNRATDAGYWKATGKDREIFGAKTGFLIGMKKTLVFYTGRAPKGEKSNWVMHEYRLEGKFAYHFLSRSSKDEWVVSRVFHKNLAATVKRSRTNTTVSIGSPSTSSQQLPPLLDPSPAVQLTDRDSCSYDSTANNNQDHHVPCFSTTTNAHPMMPLLSSSIFGRPINTGAGGLFQDVKPMQDNSSLQLQLPNWFSPAFAPATPAVGPAEGGQSGSGWKVGGTELDCMWTF